MKNERARRGFTLIELLTVVAIISILAAMLFIGGPRVMTMAKLANLKNTCNQIRTIAVAYFASKQSLPPAYGYKLRGGGYNFKPYLAYFDNEFGNFKIYDPFGQNTYDTDQDVTLSLLEYCPIGTRDALGSFVFLQELYPGPGGPFTAGLQSEVDRQLNGDNQRPMAYIPVNLKDAEKVRKYFLLAGGTAAEFADCWDPSKIKITVPPRKYDAFVLISVGPNGHAGGLLAANPKFVSDLAAAGIAVKDYYYYFALRTYYLATRDLNNDGNFDFDYQNRMKGNPDKMYSLPDGSSRPGPIIYHFAG